MTTLGFPFFWVSLRIINSICTQSYLGPKNYVIVPPPWSLKQNMKHTFCLLVNITFGTMFQFNSSRVQHITERNILAQFHDWTEDDTEGIYDLWIALGKTWVHRRSHMTVLLQKPSPSTNIYILYVSFSTSCMQIDPVESTVLLQWLLIMMT